MRKTLVLLIAILPIAVVIAALLYATGIFAGATPVELVEVTLSSLQRSVNTNGKVEADRVYELRAPLPGFCRRPLVQEGERLNKGAEILRIEDPSLPSRLAAAEAELEAAQLDLRDVTRGPAPEELNQAEADVSKAQLALENSRKVLETDEWLLARNAISKFEVERSRQAVAEAEQALKAAMTRLEDLRKRFGELDRRRAQLKVDAARARIELLQNDRDRLVVRAPAEGTLYQFDIKDGAYVNEGDLIGLFADLSKLRVRAYADEPDLGRVAIGDKVIITWDAHPQETWNGVVTRMPSQVVALGTRSVGEVLCSIENPKGTLLPNVNVDVEIQAPEGPSVVSLPRDVVFEEGGHEFVWVIREGKAEKQLIETGRSTTDRIQVTGGLSVGDRVVDPGDMLLTEGMKVEAAGK